MDKIAQSQKLKYQQLSQNYAESSIQTKIVNGSGINYFTTKLSDHFTIFFCFGKSIQEDDEDTISLSDMSLQYQFEYRDGKYFVINGMALLFKKLSVIKNFQFLICYSPSFWSKKLFQLDQNDFHVFLFVIDLRVQFPQVQLILYFIYGF